MTDLILPRRGFLFGLVAVIAAPAIVRASSLMPVRMADYEFADPIISLAGMNHDGLFWINPSGRKFSINPVGRLSIRVVGGEIVEENYQPGGDVYEHAQGLGSLGFARVGRLSEEDYQKDRKELDGRIASSRF